MQSGERIKSKVGIFRGPKTLSVMPTYTCPAECKDCGTFSSPRDRHNLELDTILSAIGQARDNGFYNVVFTGGEPTLRWPVLLTCLARARALGLRTRIVTNAHWATSLDRARMKIEELLRAGLDEINFSTGDEHVRFIPLERVINATEAALVIGLPVNVMVEMRAEGAITESDILDHPRIKSLSRDRSTQFRVAASPWMPVDPYKVQSYPEGVAINKKNIDQCTGCDSVLQTYVLEADGRVAACCGLGMRVIDELNVGESKGDNFLSRAIEESENDFLKVWLRYEGPEKILQWASERDPEIEWENMYAHRCQACLRLYKDPKVAEVIRSNYTEIYAEVVQDIWFEEHFIPDALDGKVHRYRRFNEAKSIDSAFEPSDVEARIPTLNNVSSAKERN